MLSLFSSCNRDVDAVIVGQINDPLGILRASAVNKETQLTVNDVFFRNYFQAQYPHLIKDPLFCRLCLYFPNTYWKIACFILTRWLSPSTSYVEEHQVEVKSYIDKRLEVLKKNPETCDLDQKLDAALSEADKYKQVFYVFDSRLNAAVRTQGNVSRPKLHRACDELRKVHGSAKEMLKIFDQLRKDILFVKDPAELDARDFSERPELFNGKLDVLFHTDLIPHYLVLGKNIQRKNDLLCQWNKKEVECRQLQMIWGEFHTLEEMSRLFEEPVTTEAISRICEDILEEKDFLIAEECKAQIALYQSDLSNEELKCHIHSLIGFHSQSKLIWNSLYNYRANQSLEAQWTENHFPEFLEDICAFLDEPSKGEVVLEKQFFEQDPYFDFILYLGEVLNANSADSPERVQEKIQSYVNSIVGGDKIWKALTERYGDNSQEERWAENHVMEFLPEFFDIIQALQFV